MLRTLSFGPFTFHGYGFILGLAIVAGWWWAERLWNRISHPPIHFSMIGLWAILGGIVGARLYHVIDYGWYYGARPLEVFAIWMGGLGIWGAVIGGMVGLLCLSWWKKIPALLLLDLAAAALPLSQAIGRWGNWINFELYGKPTLLPWKWWIPPEFRPQSFIEVGYYHPLFLYESLLMTGLFFVINYFIRPRWAVGTGGLLGGYLLGYGLIRLVLEPLRITPWTIQGLPVAQGFALFAILIGSGLTIWVGWRYAKQH